MTPSRRSAGFTLLELMIVVAIIGIAAAMAVPSFEAMQSNGRLRDASRAVANALQIARARSISTGNNHIVYLSAGGNTDICGNALPTDPVGGPVVAALVLDDGPPGAGNNCCVDPGEWTEGVPAVNGINWGVNVAAPPIPQVLQDVGGGGHGDGSSFADQNGLATRWVMFRPDGVPVGLSTACNAGMVGSGGGGVYVSNTDRDYAVVLSPLGGVKVYGWDRSQGGGAGAWSN